MDMFGLVLACLAAGGLIGFSGGVLGIGGGLFAIPLLGLILGYEQQAAQGTALIMVLPAVLLTLRKYHQHAPIDWRSAAAGAASSVVCTWIGARFALGLDPWLLRRIYAGFVFLIAVFYFRESLGRRAQPRPAGFYREVAQIRKSWYFCVGIFAGLAGGVFGVGGSVLAVPFLTSVFHLRQTSAQAVALAMIVPGTAVALATYAWHGQAHGLVGIPLAAGSLLCVPYGVRLAYALPEARLKLIFACMLLLIMGLLLMKS
ncbi:MAG: sulfite exporter TauE/SafE family protein [Castellaniella sp.]|uniref:sulfite exporter TauE/SafE family protein n=1 Tax=Castellaniella sp. TaxID=1955812 RepID=UPI002A36F840|nr:sulfite exporter TauE/SafE family protein [Castellaniella sp.]MDY0310398.1 sulfite exporter TauE/SafE family protein [Castellaniella sp.]